MSTPKKQTIMLDELDCSYNDAPICPHRGHAHQDSWEWADDSYETEIQCENADCGKWFSYETECSRTFSTSKSCAPGEHNFVESHRNKYPGMGVFHLTLKCSECGHITHKTETIPAQEQVKP